MHLAVHSLSVQQFLYWNHSELVRLLVIFITFIGSASVLEWEVSACARTTALWRKQASAVAEDQNQQRLFHRRL